MPAAAKNTEVPALTIEKKKVNVDSPSKIEPETPKIVHDETKLYKLHTGLVKIQALIRGYLCRLHL